LVTWNVLADAYAKPQFYPHLDRALLRRGARIPGIVAWLAASDADVACLQEAEPPLIEALRQAGGWDVHYAPKVGKPDGCAMLARRAASLEDVRTIELADGAPDRTDSGHIALHAILRDGPARCELATSHLKWDPPGTASEQRWATRQVRHLVSAFGELDRAIVCGDLNVEPTDRAYHMLIEAGFVDPMAAELRPTANPNGRAKRIDHVLCGRALVATPLPVMEIDDTTPLPSSVMPSDHVPVGVAIEL
jgi:mRNA deadenylase 3'-5' endonuclease subunit Ccr4